MSSQWHLPGRPDVYLKVDYTRGFEGSAAAGARSVTLVCLVAAPPGIERVHGEHPDVHIVCASVDRALNDRGFIVPGLGDAGDRLYGTK